MKHRGVVCDKCGVEVTQASVRRSRLGHIELACPVSHVWFFKVPPSRIGTGSGSDPSELERILYYESYVVLDPGDVDIALLREKEITLTLEEVQLLQQLFAFSFDERDDGCTVGNVRLGTLRKGQVVTEDQDRLLKRLFGRTDDEFRERLKRPGRTYSAGMGAGAAKQLLHEARSRNPGGRVASRHAARAVHPKADQSRETAEGRGCFPQVGEPARVDDHGRHPGDPAGPSSAGSSGWWSFRNERSQRALPEGHQPQQSPPAAARASRGRT